jgi:hypothetical protein
MVVEIYRGFSRFLHVNVGVVTRYNHDRFYSNPFQFSIPSEVYGGNTEGVVVLSTKKNAGPRILPLLNLLKNNLT